ncbi:DNA-directed RNA polymerase III subunit RPC4 [Ciona intestinalis]
MASKQKTPAKVKEEQSSLTRPGRLKSSSSSMKSDQSPSRLPSLRGPRDLTLGGIKKKTFSPVIPVRKERIKTEIKEEKLSTKQPRIKRERSNPARGRGRGRGRGFKQEIIQSHSIFESGPTVERSDRGRGTSMTSSSVTSEAQIQKPTIKKETVDLLQEKAESEETMKKLEAGNTAIIAGLENDEKLKPVVLPVASNDKPAKIKGSQPCPSNPLQCSRVFRWEGKEKLILLQIPDSLPGVPPSGEDEVKAESTTKKEATQDSHCSLDQLSEGRIGKIQILKSGRCRLVLGGVTMEMRTGTPSSFAEELVSIRLPPEGSPDTSRGHMSILGSVNEKIVCVPDIASLLKVK